MRTEENYWNEIENKIADILCEQNGIGSGASSVTKFIKKEFATEQTAALKKEVETYKKGFEGMKEAFNIQASNFEKSLEAMLVQSKKFAEQQSEIARLRELLQDAANGLQWYYDTLPELNSNVDLEMLNKIKLTLQNQAG